MAAPPAEDRPGDSPEVAPSSSESYLYPGLVEHPSRELTLILYRAAFIGNELGEEYNLSFATILFGFMASDTPSTLWLRKYADSIGVNLRLLNPKWEGSQILEILERASRMGESIPRSRIQPTGSAVRMVRAAEELGRRVSNSSLVFPHHLLGAYIYRCPPDHEYQLAAWGFDRPKWSRDFLSFMESETHLYQHELKLWKQIHRETFGNDPDDEPEPTPSPTPVEVPPDVTPLHLDNPADADYLGRRGFAEALAVRLNRVWGECNRPGEVTAARSSFVLHLHGPWGSGKTSLLNFLKRELQPAPGKSTTAPESRGWVVVEFNAWQNQRISPPWWPLLESVSKQAAQQTRDVFGAPLSALWLRLREWWWRFSRGRTVYLVTAAIAFALAALWYVLTRASLFNSEWANVTESAKSLVAYVTVVVGVWSTVQHVSRSLISGSSRSAQTFIENVGDPMERISAHFRELVGWVGRPLVVFLDDLDRCQPKYVVELLEGVQTLFSDPRVVYVVAADRRWLNTCFETAYKDFAAAVKEPGRPLGSLFLEKAFELSVSVPRLSDEMRQVYWDFLVGGTRRDLEQAIRERSAEAEREFEGAATEEQVLKVLSTVSPLAAGLLGEKRDALREQVLRGAAVKQLASSEVVASTEYFLKPFAPLLEPNPRAMKRLVNAYSVLRDMALLAGVDVLGDLAQRRQLALWAIVSLRWPLLEEYLESHPEMIDPIREVKPGEDGFPSLGDEQLQKLAESEEVRNVFRGGATQTGLSREVVCQIVGISAAQPTAASVA